MSELEFKLYLFKNYNLLFRALDMFNYEITLSPDFVIVVTFNEDINNKIKQCIIIYDDNNYVMKYFYSYKRALDYIKKNWSKGKMITDYEQR